MAASTSVTRRSVPLLGNGLPDLKPVNSIAEKLASGCACSRELVSTGLGVNTLAISLTREIGSAAKVVDSAPPYGVPIDPLPRECEGRAMIDFTLSLTANPVTIEQARRSPTDGGAPESAGLYAWWSTTAGQMATVPSRPHPTDSGLRLLYVGTAPSRSTSKETVRSRALKQHASLGLAGSTFRRSLAALLWDAQGWEPLLTASGRFKLAPCDDKALLDWQIEHLRLSWTEIDEAWNKEKGAIAQLEPPLNLSSNRTGEFYPVMSAARERFKAAAGGGLTSEARRR